MTDVRLFLMRAARTAIMCSLATTLVTGCASPGKGTLPGALPAALAPSERTAPAFDQSPDASDAASPITLKPRTLALYGTGKASAQTVTITEKKRTTFTVDNKCGKIATVTTAKTKHVLSFKATVTPSKSGKCSIIFSDASGHKATLRVADAPGGQLVFPLIIPLRAPLAKHPVRQPKWISPSTQAMVVTLQRGTEQQSIVSGLTQTSPNCQLTTSGLDCTFGTYLAACPSSTPCYDVTVTTYDGWDDTSQTIPASAAPLSISKSSFSIGDNQVKNVAFTFSGIPAQITVLPASALSTQTGNIIDLVGPGSHPMLAEAMDADGNMISGAGSPSYKISSSGTLKVTYTQPAAGSPRFTVTPPSTLQGPATLASLLVTAVYPASVTNACALTGAVCSGSVTLDMQSLLAVSTGLAVELFAAEKGLGPLTGLTSGINAPVRRVAYDTAGNLYVAAASQGYPSTVLEFALGSTSPSRTITTGAANPEDVETDVAGNLFVLNGGTTATVSKYAPGATSPASTTNVAPYGSRLVVDSSDDFWLLSQGQSVTYYAHGASSGTQLTGLVDPQGITLDPATNTVYVSDKTYSSGAYPCGSNGAGTFCTIYRYAAGSTTPVTFSNASYGGDLVFVPNVGLFADNFNGPDIAYYNTAGALPVTPLSSAADLSPGEGQGIAVDQLGNMFIAAPSNATVYAYHGLTFVYGDTTPYLMITNGLTFPYNLAIVP
jgi:hypothetical protein